MKKIIILMIMFALLSGCASMSQKFGERLGYTMAEDGTWYDRDGNTFYSPEYPVQEADGSHTWYTDEGPINF